MRKKKRIKKKKCNNLINLNFFIVLINYLIVNNHLIKENYLFWLRTIQYIIIINSNENIKLKNLTFIKNLEKKKY